MAALHRLNGLDFISPWKQEGSLDETRTLGAIAALWMASDLHRSWPISLMERNVWPAIKTRQFMLCLKGGAPVAYLSWAILSDEAEARYVVDPICLSLEDWTSGEHKWIVDWISPYGHAKALMTYLRRQFGAEDMARYLRVKPDKRGHARIGEWAGQKVPRPAHQAYAADFLERLKKNPRLRA